MKKVLVIGATGTIGNAVVDALEGTAEVIRASRNGDVQIDIDDPHSIRAGLERVGPLDAIIVSAGQAAFGELDALRDEDFDLGVRSKLMGQVNVVREAKAHLQAGGSITLTSGILSHSPWPQTSAIALVNGGLESFVRAAALDRAGSQRINIVSPPLVRETAVAMGMGEQGVPAAEVARVYVDALQSEETGKVFEVPASA